MRTREAQCTTVLSLCPDIVSHLNTTTAELPVSLLCIASDHSATPCLGFTCSVLYSSPVPLTCSHLTKTLPCLQYLLTRLPQLAHSQAQHEGKAHNSASTSSPRSLHWGHTRVYIVPRHLPHVSLWNVLSQATSYSLVKPSSEATLQGSSQHSLPKCTSKVKENMCLPQDKPGRYTEMETARRCARTGPTPPCYSWSLTQPWL